VYGAFEIQGDGSLDPAADASGGLTAAATAKTNPLDAAKQPQRGLTLLIAEADEDKLGDRLTSLDVRGLLTHVSVSVTEEEPVDPQKGASGWSRLDFEGTEIALGLSEDMASGFANDHQRIQNGPGAQPRRSRGDRWMHRCADSGTLRTAVG
jgi:hypothetical protein